LLGRARASIIAMHVLLSPLAALALSLASAPTGLPIRWDTTPACVDAAVVPARVVALLGQGSTPAGSLGLGAEPHGEGWRISLALEPGSTAEATVRRTLEGRDCATLTEAVALVVAVHLDAVAAAGVIMTATTGEPRPRPPSSPARSLPPASAPPSSAAPQLSAAPPLASDASARASSRSRPRGVLGIAAAGELGVLPRGAAALELAGGVAWPRVRLELGGLASVGPDGTSEQLSAVGGRFRLFTGLLRACGVPSRGRLELPLCGGLELGDLRATGTGLQRPATVDALWVAAVGSARPQWALGSRLAVGALLDLVVPLRRHRFATPEAGPVHEVAPVAVRLGVHVELRLP
jgi:hypothetical protein